MHPVSLTIVFENNEVKLVREPDYALVPLLIGDILFFS